MSFANQDEECRNKEKLNFTFAAHLLSNKESTRKRNFPTLEKDESNAAGKPKRPKEDNVFVSCGPGQVPEEADAPGKRENDDPTVSEDQLNELEFYHIGYEEEKSKIDFNCQSPPSESEGSSAVAQVGQAQVVECNELPLSKNKALESLLSLKANNEGVKSADHKDDPSEHKSLFEVGDHIGEDEMQSKKLDFERCGNADIAGGNAESPQLKHTTPTVKDTAKCSVGQVAKPQSQSPPDEVFSLVGESGLVKTKKRKQAPSPIKEGKENTKEFPTLQEKRTRKPRLSSRSSPRRRSQGNLRPRGTPLLEAVDEEARSVPRCKPKPGTKRIFKGVDELPQLYTSMFHAIGFAIWGKARRYCPAMIVSPFDLHKNAEAQTKWIEMYQKVEAKGSTEELKYLVYFPGSKSYDLVHPTDFVGYEEGLEKAKKDMKTQENAKGLKILEEDSKKPPHQRSHYSLELPCR